MYLHMEQSNAVHNSAKMMQDIIVANDFIYFNGESITVDAVEIYPMGKNFNISIVTSDIDNVEFNSSGSAFVKFVGYENKWEMKGRVASLARDGDSMNIEVTNIAGIQMRKVD